MESGSQEQARKPLPPNITTPKKGALTLSSTKSTTKEYGSKDEKSHLHRSSLRSGGRRKVHRKRGHLTRYPVERVPPKPMDIIEGHLEQGMTWSQLKHNVQLMHVSALHELVAYHYIYISHKNKHLPNVYCVCVYMY